MWLVYEVPSPLLTGSATTVNKIGTSQGMKVIKDMCPEDVDYGEIRMIFAEKAIAAKSST